MKDKLQEILYRSFDEKLSLEEELQLNAALMRSEELREEKNNILKIRKKVSSNKHITFNEGFSDRVMDKIKTLKQGNSGEEFFNSLFLTFKKITLAAAVFLSVIISYNMIKNDEISLAAALSVSENPLEQIIEPELNLFVE